MRPWSGLKVSSTVPSIGSLTTSQRSDSAASTARTAGPEHPAQPGGQYEPGEHDGGDHARILAQR